MKVWNPRRTAPRTPGELHEKVAHAYQYASGAVGAAHPAAVFSPVPLVEQPAVALKEPEWQEDWTTTPQGHIVRCLKNLIQYLRCPRYGLAGVFGYNEFTNRIEFVRLAPWHDPSSLTKNRPVSDSDLQLLRGYLATKCAYDASREDVEAAITNVAFHKRFHPVREYLNGLKWDGVPRLDLWLRDFLGVKDTPYS